MIRRYARSGEDEDLVTPEGGNGELNTECGMEYMSVLCCFHIPREAPDEGIKRGN
jgi:hypothetical protein